MYHQIHPYHQEIYLLQFLELNQLYSYLPVRTTHRSIATVPASSTMDQDVLDETLYSQAGPINRATKVIEQPTYPGQFQLQFT